MKRSILLICTVLLVNCSSDSNEDFKDIYQREICDKYSMYANSKDLNGSLSLYAEGAMVNNSAVEPIIGLEKIKEGFVQWYDNAETINHSATVISAKVFGNEAFAYGRWKVDQVLKDGTRSSERGHWSTHNRQNSINVNWLGP